MKDTMLAAWQEKRKHPHRRYHIPRTKMNCQYRMDWSSEGNGWWSLRAWGTLSRSVSIHHTSVWKAAFEGHVKQYSGPTWMHSSESTSHLVKYANNSKPNSRRKLWWTIVYRDAPGLKSELTCSQSRTLTTLWLWTTLATSYRWIARGELGWESLKLTLPDMAYCIKPWTQSIEWNGWIGNQNC